MTFEIWQAVLSPLSGFYAHPVIAEIAVLLSAGGSMGLLLTYGRKIKDPQLILGFLLFVVTMGLFLQHWGLLGGHQFTGGFILWPLLVFLLGDRLPWPVVYPLAFVSTLLPDLYGMLLISHGAVSFSGIMDAHMDHGLLVVPLETMIAAAVLHQVGTFLRKKGYFDRRICEREIS